MFSGNRIGKQFSNFVAFIDVVRSGKSAVIIATDYVVLDKASYEQHHAKLNAARAEAVLAFVEHLNSVENFDETPRPDYTEQAAEFIAAQDWLPQEPKEGQ